MDFIRSGPGVQPPTRKKPIEPVSPNYRFCIKEATTVSVPNPDLRLTKQGHLSHFNIQKTRAQRLTKNGAF